MKWAEKDDLLGIYQLSLILALLNVFDIVTTAIFMKHGGIEVNPIPKMVFDSIGLSNGAILLTAIVSIVFAFFYKFAKKRGYPYFVNIAIFIFSILKIAVIFWNFISIYALYC